MQEGFIMNRGAILDRSGAISISVQPQLRDLFIPCPVCKGTLDLTSHGKVICCSCKAAWNLKGEPVKNNNGDWDDDE